MAGDWIKFRTALVTDGRLRVVAKKLQQRNAVGNANSNAYRVMALGALVTLWCLADEQADEEGLLYGYDVEDIDKKVGIPGFCEALPDDWISDQAGWIKLPNYQEHNGTTAKKRAQNAKRQARLRRHAGRHAASVTQDATTASSREEKRREENKKGWRLPSGVDPEAWQEFEEHRKSLRKPLSDLARTKNAKVLVTLSKEQQRAVVDTTIANNWSGLFPPKGRKSKDVATEDYAKGAI